METIDRRPPPETAMYRANCPPTHRWSALLADDLPPAEQADLNGHLELCLACQRTLEECAAGRDDWAAARTLAAMTQLRSAVLGDVIDGLKLDPESDHAHHDGAELPVDFLDPPLRAGTIGRIHQYEVLEEIGRGGMGVVLKALDTGLHRVVAIKVLAPQLAVSGTARKRFTREARAAAAIGHENVVTIHAVEEFKGLPYLVMHYVAGPSVQQKLAADGPLPVADILRIGFQTAAGLAAAHAQGLIHRDVKPANILLENGVGRVKLTDFSLARAIDDASVTQTGVVTGTPPYMAPEQARGEPLDHRADLFSLGSVLYALCTGRPPFRGQALDVLRKVSEEQPVSIRSLNPEIPTWLEAIVNKLMAKGPDGRYQSAGEVAAVLEQCLAHVQQPQTVLLPTIPAAPARDVHDSRPRRWTSVAIAAGLIAIVAGVLVVRVKTARGTLEMTVDDPAATVTVEGTDIVVSGLQGMKEFRLKPGDYTVHETRAGQPGKIEIVSIARDAKTPLKVTFEEDHPIPPAPPQIEDTLLRLQDQKKRISDLLGRDNAQVKEMDDRIAELERFRRLGPNVNQLDVNTALMKATIDRADAARAAADAAEDQARRAEKLAAAGFPQSTAAFARAKADKARQLAIVTEEEAKKYRDAFDRSGARKYAPPAEDPTAEIRQVEQMLLQLRMQEKDLRQLLGADHPRIKAVNDRIAELERLRAAGPKVNQLEVRTASQQAVVDRAQAARAAADVAEERARHAEKLAAAGQVPQSVAKIARAKADAARQLAIASEEEAKMYRDALDRSDASRKSSSAENSAADSRQVEQMLLQLRTQEEELSQFLGANHPRIKEVNDRIAEVEKLIKRRADAERAAAKELPGASAVEVERLKDLLEKARADAETAKAELELTKKFLTDELIAAQKSAGPSVNRPQRNFPTAAGEVSSVAFTADGKTLFVADWNGSIYAYDFATGKVRFNVAAGKSGGSRFIAVSPDNKLLVGVGSDSTIQFVDDRSGRVRQSFDGKCAPYYAVAFSPDGKTLAAGGSGPDGRGGLLELWDVKTGQVKTAEFSDPVYSLAFPREVEDRLAVGTGGANVFMIYPSTAKKEYSLGQPGPVRALAFAPDGQRLAASSNEFVHLWDWGSTREVARLKGHSGRITAIQFSPDGKRLLTGSLDGAARLWDARSYKGLKAFAPGTYKTGMGVALFTPDGKSVVTAGDDGMVRVWDLGDAKTADASGKVPVLADIPIVGDLFQKRMETQRQAADAALADARARLDTAAAVEAKARESQPQRSFPTDAHEVSSAVFSPDGTQLYVADWSGNLYGQDFATGNTWFTIAAGQYGLHRYLAMSPDGGSLASVGTEQQIHLWDLKTGKLRQTLRGKADPYFVVAFSADGRTLAAGGRVPQSAGGLLQLWDMQSVKVRTDEFPNAIRSLVFPRGVNDRLAVGTVGEGVRMIDPSSARQEYSLSQPGPIRALAVSPDGKVLAASDDAHVHLWDWASNREVARLTGHAGRVTGLQFSPDGRWLATASLDGTAKLWEMPARRLAATFAPGKYKTGMGVALFTPDGKSLVTAGDDRMIHVWDLTAATTRAINVPGLPAGPGAGNAIKETTPAKTPNDFSGPPATRARRSDDDQLRELTVPANHANQCMTCHQATLPEDHGRRQPTCYPDPKPAAPRP
jgi:WD40 repeat protein